MRVSVTDAESRLAELVRLAEAGDDVVLTRQGEADVRLVPVPETRKPSEAEKKAVLDRIRASAPRSNGEDSARSQDFLYNEDGMPE